MSTDTVVKIETQPEFQAEQTHLTLEDKQWLEGLGCTWPDAEPQVYLDELNTLVAAGSRPVSKKDFDVEDIETVFARELFYGKLANIQGAVKWFSGRDPYLMPIDTFVSAQRVLNETGVSNAATLNKFPPALGYSASTLTDKITNLREQGLDPADVITKRPAVIGQGEQVINDKMAHLTAMGINAVEAAAKNPNIFGLSAEAVTDRLNNLESLGLDTGLVLNGNPMVFNYAPASVRAKMRVLYATAKAWGWDDYRQRVNAFVEEFPQLLGYAPSRIRVLARIASTALPPKEADEVTLKDIRAPLFDNLESMVVGYLKEGNAMEKPNDMYGAARKYRPLGKEALQAVIAEHPDDPVVKKYHRHK